MPDEKTQKKVLYPEIGEMIVGNVTKVFPYGVFVKLEEYPGKDGMIHVSEVSHKWVKNIRDHAKEGERIVAKVLKIDREKGHIDLSFKSVKAMQKKERLEEYQKEGRAEKLLELEAKDAGIEGDIEKVKSELMGNFDGLYPGLEEILKNKDAALKKLDLTKKWKDALEKIVSQHIKLPKVNIKATYKISSKAPDGVEEIKKAVQMGEKKVDMKDVDFEIKYMGAPDYRAEVTALDYKTAEKALTEAQEEITKNLGKDSTFEVIRE